jgi:exodeoxyribonuclease VII small subunit
MQDFEHTLEKLEQLVAKMETGKLSLEETLRCFEKGVKLTADCQKALKDAEQRISQVSEKNGLLVEAPFAPSLSEDRPLDT